MALPSIFNLNKIFKKEVKRPLLDENHIHFEMQSIYQKGGYTAFVNVPSNGWTMLNKEPIWEDDIEYFICLDKHKNVCKYSLCNMPTDIETQFYSDFYDADFTEWTNIEIPKKWNVEHIFMKIEPKLRINPKAKC